MTYHVDYKITTSKLRA